MQVGPVWFHSFYIFLHDQWLKYIYYKEHGLNNILKLQMLFHELSSKLPVNFESRRLVGFS